MATLIPIDTPQLAAECRFPDCKNDAAYMVKWPKEYRIAAVCEDHKNEDLDQIKFDPE